MVKFIILANPRTGTTVVSHSLSEHPDVLLYGELLHPEEPKRKHEASRKTLGCRVKRTKEQLEYSVPACSENDDGYEYLKKIFSLDVPFKAMGFKLFFHHAMEGLNARAWEYIAGHRDIKVIHINRQNIFEIIVSYARAYRSYKWHSDKPVETRPFEIPTLYCENSFKELEKLFDKHKGLLDTHPLLSMEYEQVRDDFQGCMEKVCSFLELEKGVEFTPRLMKIGYLEPPEEISNYTDLKEYFKDSKYGKYFIW